MVLGVRNEPMHSASFFTVNGLCRMASILAVRQASAPAPATCAVSAI
jgi:hypothetical protein